MLASNPRFAQAEAVALERLITIARDSECEHEARLAAEAILKLCQACRLSEPAPRPAEPLAPARASAESPLSGDELSELAACFPSVKPQRFLNKHTPAYWRAALDRHRRSVATGPPRRAA
ncbi:MAG: hypothetical protein IT438_08695 [Phycisphaerales bacterium]|nr:hypothetical protein [Phycisphaerales bacterium]